MYTICTKALELMMGLVCYIMWHTDEFPQILIALYGMDYEVNKLYTIAPPYQILNPIKWNNLTSIFIKFSNNF